MRHLYSFVEIVMLVVQYLIIVSQELNCLVLNVDNGGLTNLNNPNNQEYK
jgi:hypothetical protein